jgi:hypothetical protein
MVPWKCIEATDTNIGFRMNAQGKSIGRFISVVRVSSASCAFHALEKIRRNISSSHAILPAMLNLHITRMCLKHRFN